MSSHAADLAAFCVTVLVTNSICWKLLNVPASELFAGACDVSSSKFWDEPLGG